MRIKILTAKNENKNLTKYHFSITKKKRLSKQLLYPTFVVVIREGDDFIFKYFVAQDKSSTKGEK